MYKLCWISNSWNTPERFRGIPSCSIFNTLDDLKRVMSKCIYNGEWVEDEKGNKLDIDLREICAKIN